MMKLYTLAIRPIFLERVKKVSNISIPRITLIKAKLSRTKANG